jgi:hypothetical protein
MSWEERGNENLQSTPMEIRSQEHNPNIIVTTEDARAFSARSVVSSSLLGQPTIRIQSNQWGQSKIPIESAGTCVESNENPTKSG